MCKQCGLPIAGKYAILASGGVKRRVHKQCKEQAARLVIWQLLQKYGGK